MKTEPSTDMFFRKNSTANNQNQNLLIDAGKKTEPQITNTLVCRSKLQQIILLDILKGRSAYLGEFKRIQHSKLLINFIQAAGL